MNRWSEFVQFTVPLGLKKTRNHCKNTSIVFLIWESVFFILTSLPREFYFMLIFDIWLKIASHRIQTHRCGAYRNFFRWSFFQWSQLLKACNISFERSWRKKLETVWWVIVFKFLASHDLNTLTGTCTDWWQNPYMSRELMLRPPNQCLLMSRAK